MKKILTNLFAFKGPTMQKRDNVLFDHIVNKALIMRKFRGDEQAKHMMIKAGLPRSVINRILLENQNVRKTDWH